MLAAGGNIVQTGVQKQEVYSTVLSEVDSVHSWGIFSFPARREGFSDYPARRRCSAEGEDLLLKSSRRDRSLIAHRKAKDVRYAEAFDTPCEREDIARLPPIAKIRAELNRRDLAYRATRMYDIIALAPES
jgi:hypothetical protein